MTLPFQLKLEPSRDKAVLRKQLQAERMALLDRHQRAAHLQEVLQVWLITDASGRSAPTGRSRVSSTPCRRGTGGARATRIAASACR